MNHRYQPARDPHDGLWWQIALGIFVGQIMFIAVAGIALAFMAAAANVQAEEEARQLSRQLQQMTAPIRPTYTPRPAPTRSIRPLSDGERCIGGHRYARLPNGWKDLPNDPC